MTQMVSSPHIRSDLTARRIMIEVVLALLPALIAGVFLLGFRVLLVAAVCVCVSLLSEWIWEYIRNRSNAVQDMSAVVTALLLAMTLPVTIPLWQAAVGSIFAIVFVKKLSGGIGRNIFNPALAGRALMLLLWPSSLTHYTATGADAISAATPLHTMRIPALTDIGLTEMLLGRTQGSIGEISALALLIGGLYLLVRGIISPRVPAAYLGSFTLLSLIFHDTETPIIWMLYSLFSGGVVMGAFFMATDYTTSPVTPWGQWIYGVGCGALTVFFRRNSLYPEGVTYAILLMNSLVWLIERFTPPRRFGKIGGTICD